MYLKATCRIVSFLEFASRERFEIIIHIAIAESDVDVKFPDFEAFVIIL